MISKLNRVEILKAAQRQKIERVVCSGGGAKGVVYAGSYKAMKDTGFFKGVREFSGASAGAITAAFMATGMSPNLLREQLFATNLKDLMGHTIGKFFGKNPPGVSFLTKDGQLLEDFIRDNIIQVIKNSLQRIRDRAREEEDPGLEELCRKLEGAKPSITFADLALLNRYFPEDFKKLRVPAVKFPGGEVQIFNSELTPDVEIALACRASSSIPVVLKPVEIEVDGRKQKFVDGGLYDNLPADCFDQGENGKFLANQKPMQTIIFAFGEGLDDKKNPVFQALYGHHWDDAISNEFLNDIFKVVFARCKGKRFALPQEEAELIIGEVKKVVNELQTRGFIASSEAQVVTRAMTKALRNLLLKPEENQIFWQHYHSEKNQDAKRELLAAFIKQDMKPVLYQAGFIEKLKRDVLVEMFGGMKAAYKNTAQKEIGYQKLHSDYTLRTVELRVGTIKTTDFSKATRLARVMDSLGYLDTVNYITNHELNDPDDFDTSQFYINLVHVFTNIYKATLLSSGKEWQQDILLQEIQELKEQLKTGRASISDAEINRQVYQFIKDKVEVRLDSVEAFALSRAVEFHNKALTAEELFKETYEQGFKRSGVFSLSNITGCKFFRSASLHASLQNKDMFHLFNQQKKSEVSTRTDKVFSVLSDIGDFADAYQSWDKQQIPGP